MVITRRAVAIATAATVGVAGVAVPAYAEVRPATLEAAESNAVEDFVLSPDLLIESQQKANNMTQEQVEEIHSYLGEDAVVALEDAMRAGQSRGASEVAPAALPAVIAGVAIAAVAWCASGALASVPTSALTDMINRGEGGGDYVQNAIVGCIAGNIGSLAWKLLPQRLKQSVYSSVVNFYWNNIR